MKINEHLSRLETEMTDMKQELKATHTMLKTLPRWFMTTILTLLIGIGAIVIGQTSWFQHSLNQSRDEQNNRMAKVEAQQEKRDVEYRAQQAEWNNKFNRTLDELRDLRNQHDKRLYKLEVGSQNNK